MSAIVPTFRLRGRVAALSRDRGPCDPDLVDAKAQLAVQNIINFVTRTLAKAPPLSDEQRQQLISLFEVGTK